MLAVKLTVLSQLSLYIDFFACHLLDGFQGLCEWRDVVARAEDESTGYILPNKILLEIGT